MAWCPWQYTSNSVVVVIVTCTFVCFNKKTGNKLKCTLTDLTKKNHEMWDRVLLIRNTFIVYLAWFVEKCLTTQIRVVADRGRKIYSLAWFVEKGLTTQIRVAEEKRIVMT